jgi:hypothetical protein
MPVLAISEVLHLKDEAELAYAFLHQQDAYHRCLGTVLRMDHATLTLKPSAESTWFPEEVQAGSALGLYIAKPSGIWHAALCIKTLKSATGLLICTHENRIEQVQRRRHVRISYEGLVDVRIVLDTGTNPVKAPAHSQAITATMENLSAGGLRANLPIPLPSGQPLHVSFDVKTHPRGGKPDIRHYELNAVVTYSYPQTPEAVSKPTGFLKAGQTVYSTAVQFKSVPPSLEKQLVQQCFQIEIEQRRATQPYTP